MEKLGRAECWESFYEYKCSSEHFLESERADLRRFIDNREYEGVIRTISEKKPFPLPLLREINKKGTDKKRKVFMFARRENYVMKLIAFLLHGYEHIFPRSLYSFRRGVGVKQAIDYITTRRGISEFYTYKVDIHDYFNSVDTERVLEMLKRTLTEDGALYEFIAGILREPRAKYMGSTVECKKGIMAGVPFAGFLANLYLSELDSYFESKGVLYARYSDDIIVFANSAEDIAEHERVIKAHLEKMGLLVNEKKEFRTLPGESWEFLGFSIEGRVIDVSRVTLEKIKAKMRRKARSLLRWKKRKGASDKGAARAFIRHFNKKMYDNPKQNDITWALWYFPVINTDKSLRIIDEYAVQSARFIAAGNHSKTAYNLRYEDIKEMGYRNLVNSFYKFKRTGAI